MYYATSFFFPTPMWCFDSILVHGLPLRDCAITLTGYTTLSMTPLDELSALQRDLYLTTHNTCNTRTSMPPQQDSNPQSQQVSGCRPMP
jgi:hypothetical protein